jgi:hypothetical protein
MGKLTDDYRTSQLSASRLVTALIALLAIASTSSAWAHGEVRRIQGVNKLAAATPDVIRHQYRLDPAGVGAGSYGYEGGASDNTDEVAAALDLVAYYHGHATSAPIEKVIAFLERKLAPPRRWMQKEGSLASSIYVRHQWPPTLVQWAIAEALVARGEERFRPVAAGLRGWLRAGIGWGALGGTWFRARSMTAREVHLPPGARVLLADGEPNRRFAGTFAAVTGKRGWNWHEGEWLQGDVSHLLSAYLWEFGFGEAARVSDLIPNAEAKALRSIGLPTAIFTPDEQARIRAATHNDTAALDWVVAELLRDWMPADPVEGIRTSRGVSTVMLSAGAGATSAIVAGTDNGHRGSPTSDNRNPHRAWIDLAARRGWAEATAGSERVRVEFPLARGELVYHWRAHDETGFERIFPPRGATPPPVTQPPPPPTPRRRSGGCGSFGMVDSAALAGLAIAARRRRAH